MYPSVDKDGPLTWDPCFLYVCYPLQIQRNDKQTLLLLIHKFLVGANGKLLIYVLTEVNGSDLNNQ